MSSYRSSSALLSDVPELGGASSCCCCRCSWPWSLVTLSSNKLEGEREKDNGCVKLGEKTPAKPSAHGPARTRSQPHVPAHNGLTVGQAGAASPVTRDDNCVAVEAPHGHREAGVLSPADMGQSCPMLRVASLPPMPGTGPQHTGRVCGRLLRCAGAGGISGAPACSPGRASAQRLLCGPLGAVYLVRRGTQ